jgi:hypothetical protein
MNPSLNFVSYAVLPSMRTIAMAKKTSSALPPEMFGKARDFDKFSQQVKRP